MVSLPEPVSSHAVSSPFSLANPAPFKATPSSSADHVHAPSGPFSWCSTFGTRFRGDFDDNLRCFVPSSVSYSPWIDGVLTRTCIVDSWWIRQTITDVKSLTTILAENKLSTRFHETINLNGECSAYPTSVLAMNSRAQLINNYAHPTIWLWTQHTSRL